ncbi:extracellular catalytic domain type 1 short-chain-length polyhydroxyalkanoate depolymerase [Streptacidiphilus fuscans]|uniref:PHB depolymerase family esterase n=1 Tax=Streptacidiphilus fuscans TaxID=2789292 RepID=A0A931B7S2_9ACTN|nr:PHB depolymerase family esterase [Streptacidiphilus fuscans]MBF9071696.1 PHB depolymerase family esterase [Streptacidiphilus fuscans]
MNATRSLLATAAAAGLALAALITLPNAAHANSGSLTQVSSFGSNPGNLAMYEYAPANLPTGAPVVVALHGCTQSASDYYNDSGWPQLADQYGFAVVFPQTDSTNNALSCFSWFDSTKDTRGNGEAASVISMVDHAEQQYGSDTKRVFVTGLSAGAGMTADLLADYPDVFAAGSIDSGLPAQCATTETAATSCQDSNQNLTAAQWGTLARNSDSGYSGPWPRVAIWQGTADTTVYPVNATELMDQWTNVWGISQTASSTQSLTGGTTESSYDDSSGNPAVEVYSISGMSHGLAVNPGTGPTQCGTTGAYFLNYICSSYYTAQFWGLTGSTSTATPTPTPTSTTSASASPSASASASPSTSASASPSSTYTPTCYNASNYAQVQAGRAYDSGGYAYADGSAANLGLDNVFYTHTLEETAPGYYVIADSGCPA